jgi:hypothetical protein
MVGLRFATTLTRVYEQQRNGSCVNFVSASPSPFFTLFVKLRSKTLQGFEKIRATPQLTKPTKIPPPVARRKVMSKTYLAKLRAASDEANLRHEEAKAQTQHVDPRVLCDKPLTAQIEELMLSLPPVLRDSPWSMDELVARLQGRYSARPHPMNVGQALRAWLATEAGLDALWRRKTGVATA